MIKDRLSRGGGYFCQPQINKEKGIYEEKIIGTYNGDGFGDITFCM